MRAAVQRLCVALGATVWLHPAAAQPVDSQDAGKTGRIVRTDTPPVIDGRLDDPVWQHALKIDDFHQIRPGNGTPPTERTEVYLAFDSDYLYVGARCYDDEPDKIIANVMQHNDALGRDDRLAVIIDPFNAGRNGYRFETNANGVRHDMLYKNVNQPLRDWSVIWEVQSRIDDQGWSFEMAIPYKSLPFNPNIDTWGFNFARLIKRKNEEVVWVSRNRSYNPSIVGHISGFSGLDQGLGLDVVPSMATTRKRTFSPSETDTTTDPSLDVFYRLTPSLNASLTVNTDFSATEVDDRQVNLTRFSLFFPEKRDFFLNDSDLFEFGRLGQRRDANAAATRADLENGRPFFSRRLGLSATGEAVDLNYGGKLSGRTGRWSIGTLAVRQDQFQDVNASNVFVGRVAADVLKESTVGLIVTNGDPGSNVDNSLAGVDFQYLNTRLPGGRVLEATGWYQQTKTDGLEGDDTAFGASVNIPNSEGFRGSFELKQLGQNFNPAVGYVNQTGIRDTSAQLGYTHIVRDGRLHSIFGSIEARRATFLDSGGVQSDIVVMTPLEIENRLGDKVQIRYTTNKEFVTDPFTIYEDLTRAVVIPQGTYSFNQRSIEIDSATLRKVSTKFTYADGDFYDGTRVNVGGELVWKPIRKFSLTVTYDWNNIDLPEGRFTTRLVQLKTEYAFSMTLSWINLIQFDNVSEVLGINSRLHWIPKAGREAFVVLNNNSEDLDKDGVFHTAEADLNLKFAYTFRF